MCKVTCASNIGKETVAVVLIPKYETEKMSKLVRQEYDVDYTLHIINRGTDPKVSCLYKSVWPVESLPKFPKCYSGLAVASFIFDMNDCDIDMKGVLKNLGIDYSAILYGKTERHGYQLSVDDLINGVSKTGFFVANSLFQNGFGDAGKAFSIAKKDIDANFQAYKGIEIATKIAIQGLPNYKMSDSDIKKVAEKVNDSFEIFGDSGIYKIAWKPVDYDPRYLEYTSKLDDDIQLAMSQYELYRCFALIEIPLVLAVNSSINDQFKRQLMLRVGHCYGERLFQLGKVSKCFAKVKAA